MLGVPHLLLASLINCLLTQHLCFLGIVVQVNIANIKYHQNIFGQHQRMSVICLPKVPTRSISSSSSSKYLMRNRVETQTLYACQKKLNQNNTMSMGCPEANLLFLTLAENTKCTNTLKLYATISATLQ